MQHDEMVLAIDTYSKINTDKTTKDWLKNFRCRLKMTAWSVHVTTDIFLLVKIGQMIDKNAD